MPEWHILMHDHVDKWDTRTKCERYNVTNKQETLITSKTCMQCAAY